MDRLNLETHLIQNIRDLPDEKLIELLDFITHLKQCEISKKSTFVEFIRQSPLYDVELEIDRDSSVCRTVVL